VASGGVRPAFDHPHRTARRGYRSVTVVDKDRALLEQLAKQQELDKGRKVRYEVQVRLPCYAPVCSIPACYSSSSSGSGSGSISGRYVGMRRRKLAECFAGSEPGALAGRPCALMCPTPPMPSR
jgi:hypothetical protein